MDSKINNRKWILIICIVLVFSFFFGYYLCYRINEKDKTKLEIINDIMENEWYYGIDDEDISKTLEEKMILGMLDLETDPYTRYLTSLGTLADSFTGIGVSVATYGEYFIIDEVNSQRAVDDGLRVGDIIVAINDESISNKTLDELSNIIANAGNVTLKVIRNNVEMNINTSVTTYDPLTVFTKEYDDDIAYVKISEFNLDTASYLDAYFSQLSSTYVNLVIDLRGNPGGYISAVRDVLDLFLGSDKVVMTTVDKNGNSTVVKTADSAFYIFNKIVVLIDGNSASGAEAMAAAMDYHLDEIVTLYGDTTYGKGSAQKTHYFSDGTYFHYTYALWNTPFGNTINHKGVEPEIASVNQGISSLNIYDVELELYDYGDEVLNIQKLLKLLNYYQGDLHSFYDNDVKLAMEKFQAAEGLIVTGIVDNQTLRHIAKLIYDDKAQYLNSELNIVLGSMFS